MKRLGYSPWWGLLAIFPFWLPVGIWVLLALDPWPVEEPPIIEIFDGDSGGGQRLRRGLP